ncbi:MAG: AEC family transporter [Nitratireductor sp.]|nr:AEC family transporter [Nitratireductor sp.]
MLPVVESLIPVFLLIAAGFLIKRVNLVPAETWAGMERLSFYVFFPSLLFLTLYGADFSGMGASATVLAFLLGAVFSLLLGVVIRTPVRMALRLSDPSYSSVYQGFTRWNGFIALAIVEKLFGQAGLVIVAFAFLSVVIPNNIGNVAVLNWLGDRSGRKRSFGMDLLLNPIMIATLAGLAANLIAVPIYEPVKTTISLVSQVALPFGLILTGAGLRPNFEARETGAILFASVMRLLIAPVIFVGASIICGLEGQALIVIAAATSVPTAMQGYIFAKQMGGDAPLAASIATFQSVASAITIPLVIYIATLAFAG